MSNLPQPRPTVVSCLIERTRREILICTATSSNDGDRTWEFPTGIVGGDESPETAMRRLAKRLVGLHIDIRTGQPPLPGEYRDRPATYRFFLAGVQSGQAEPIGYEQVRWVNQAQLIEYDFTEPYKLVVAWYCE